ncbi:MAG: 3-oxoacyl-[acyl-carrier-protein] synthase III C-terminal domain-containing protein, partial [Pseudomonadota bacterium]
GDGAGAVILKAHTSNEHEGIISTKINAEGSLESILYTDGGVGINQKSGHVIMAGKEVFKHAVEKMSQNILDLLELSKYNKEDLDWVIPHQANARILEAIGARLNIPSSKLVMTLDKHANTSAATIPLAIDHQAKAGKIKSNDLIITTALGGGLTWGGCLLRWL